MRYWLIKSEGDCYSIDQLKKDRKTPWSGVRNFQARNFMRDAMSVGDLALFYHSNASPSGVVGVARVCSTPYEDVTARDKNDEHYDPRSYKLYEEARKNKTEFVPVWMLVDFEFVKKYPRMVSLHELKNDPVLKDMVVCQKGSRLSIQPVTKQEFLYIEKIATK
ncbi:MAG: EVE domain-containing protein [Candidatus Taylorbacteria bacterium]|nr:EVE domain-containing protein [Candidatus Taylorbacteria bacterium]